MFSKPLPPRIGQVRTTISRVKSGLSMLWPKYTLNLSDSNKFLLAGKKKSGSATSKYVISSNQNQMEKNSGGYLGKVRSNFLGTEFTIFDNGKGPKKAEQQKNNLRTQQGVVQYETNVLGSKGPRRMKVLLPNVDLQGQQHSWRPLDVSSRPANWCRTSTRSRSSSRSTTRRTSCSSSTSRPSGTSVSASVTNFCVCYEGRGASLCIEFQWPRRQGLRQELPTDRRIRRQSHLHAIRQSRQGQLQHGRGFSVQLVPGLRDRTHLIRFQICMRMTTQPSTNNICVKI